MYQDTIVAISTPLGEGGIGIVRLSGSKALQIVGQLFGPPLKDHQLVYGRILDREKGAEVVDEVLVSYMAAPRTYTREDIIEINCHGGITPLKRILELALRNGARPADPGEFTLRAFLNGRADLAQAESVLDIVQSKTRAGLRLAVEGLKGRLSGKIREVRNDLLLVLAFLTARIDFPDDEVEDTDAIATITAALQELEKLIAGADKGMVYRHGVRTAIVGRTNVGKSSLLNKLLGTNRAIVTPIPGTTRDTLEEEITLNGVPFLLIDTAGIARTADAVETFGIERSCQAIEQASLVLLVIDRSQPLNDADIEIIRLLETKSVLAIANKCDLPPIADLGELSWTVILTSAVTGEGIDELEAKMADMALGGEAIGSDELLITNARHKDALQRAAEHLSHALGSLETSMPDDFVTIDISASLEALGEITGETVTDDLLELIFSRFCIGK